MSHQDCNTNCRSAALLLAPPDRDEDRIVSKDDLKALLLKHTNVKPHGASLKAKSAA